MKIFMKNRELLKDQLNEKMAKFALLSKVSIPGTGWLKAIRIALGMSMQQMSKKLSITPQGVNDAEKRELEGSLSIKAMREMAKAMDMQFVYGFVPNDGSLDKLIDKRALELATKIVLRVSNTMNLEEQLNSDKRIRKAIKERAEQIKKENPKLLWD
jgi:predicted DNA-binding mobile mystery protein A